MICFWMTKLCSLLLLPLDKVVTLWDTSFLLLSKVFPLIFESWLLISSFNTSSFIVSKICSYFLFWSGNAWPYMIILGDTSFSKVKSSSFLLSYYLLCWCCLINLFLSNLLRHFIFHSCKYFHYYSLEKFFV